MAVEREDLLKFLKKHVRKRKEFKKITDDTELFSSGVIDSFAMVELLSWLERKTKSRLDASDLDMDKVDSIARILKFAASLER